MSHFTDINLEVRDEAALRAACAELGFTIQNNAEARGYASNSHRGEMVIRLPGPYDIAVNKNANGTYNFTADLYQGHVEKAVGKKYGTLSMLTGVHAATIASRKKGLAVQRITKPNGGIRLSVTGRAINL